MNYLESICKRITEREDNLMHTWQWQQGVALFALSEVYRKRGDKSYFAYIKRWVDAQLEKEYPGKSINTTAPCISILELYKETMDEKYGALLEDFAQWCLTRARRSERGIYEHSCTENFYDNQIWADTLFMGCLFLARYSIFTGNKMYMYEALRQYVMHYDFLKAPDSNLIIHGYYGNERIQKGVIWGRGNGWFAAGSAIMLSLADESFSDYNIIKENFVKYIEELVTYQNLDGSWNTVINTADSYSEMTATSAFAYAINEGIKLGILDEKYAENAKKACDALLLHIADDGTVKKASGGTCIMPNKEDYNAIECVYSPFGQGLAILALNSIL